MTTFLQIEGEEEPNSLVRFLPILGWLLKYIRAWLAGDIIAGLSIWTLMVPQSLGYADISGVPVQYRLYTAALALLIFPLFSTSRQVVTGPSSTISAVTGSPGAALAALIIHAVWHIITARKLDKIRFVSRHEFGLAALTVAGVLLFIDVLEGMIIGLVASLLLVIYHSSRPHIASLGRIPGIPGAYSDLKRYLENTPLRGDALAVEHNLRGYDATYLACALIWQETAGMPATLASFDSQLIVAARGVQMAYRPT